MDKKVNKRKSIKPYSFEPRRRVQTNVENEEELIEEEVEINILSSRVGNLDWCSCSVCVNTMATELECICCRELNNIDLRLKGEKCITSTVGFNVVCLSVDVLETALLSNVHIRRDTLVYPISNRAYRLAAYRQFTLWVHGRLGRHVRKVISSCVVEKIRSRFPEENGVYEGFHENDDTLI